jgi:hypothetical protein
MTRTARGWSAKHLPAVGDDPLLWTAADAARLLGPPRLSDVDVRRIIRLLQLEPVGRRRTGAYGKSGRYARVFRSHDLICAFEALYQVTHPDERPAAPA